MNITDLMISSIATWHGVSLPSEAARRTVADLDNLIRAFTALRGSLKLEDEPSSFESALLEAADVRIKP